MKRLMLVLSVLAMMGLIFSGCKKDKPADPPPPAADPAAQDEPPPPPAEPPAEPAGEPKGGDEAPAADSVGVPECDEYIGKYMKCIGDKVPEANRAAMESGLNTMREAWKKAAATEAGKAGLANACKMAMDAAKKSMGAFGCEW